MVELTCDDVSRAQTASVHPAVHGAPPAFPVGFVSVVLPCLNEEEAVGTAVCEAFRGLARAGVRGEVVVVDNGSTDRSAERAAATGARVVRQPERGYGSALAAALAASRGDVVVMADADGSYDLEDLHELLVPLRRGADLVIGARLRGEIAPGAMPGLHRYVGTPALSRALGALAGPRLCDSQSGYRAFRRQAVEPLGLRSRGMEYASEMLLKAGRAGLVVEEVPTDYRTRLGVSKLRPVGDGWRHLRLLLLLSPHATLILPGIVATIVGLALCAVSLIAPSGIPLGDVRWLPVFLGPMLLILGGQSMLLGCLAAHRTPLTPARVRRALSFLEQPGAGNRLLGGLALVAFAGCVADVALLVLWLTGHSGPSLLGVAGLAQALIVVGTVGIATLFAAADARDLLGW